MIFLDCSDLLQPATHMTGLRACSCQKLYCVIGWCQHPVHKSIAAGLQPNQVQTEARYSATKAAIETAETDLTDSPKIGAYKTVS